MGQSVPGLDSGVLVHWDDAHCCECWLQSSKQFQICTSKWRVHVYCVKHIGAHCLRTAQDHLGETCFECFIAKVLAPVGGIRNLNLLESGVHWCRAWNSYQVICKPYFSNQQHQPGFFHMHSAKCDSGRMTRATLNCELSVLYRHRQWLVGSRAKRLWWRDGTRFDLIGGYWWDTSWGVPLLYGLLIIFLCTVWRCGYHLSCLMIVAMAWNLESKRILSVVHARWWYSLIFNFLKVQKLHSKEISESSPLWAVTNLDTSFRRRTQFLPRVRVSKAIGRILQDCPQWTTTGLKSGNKDFGSRTSLWPCQSGGSLFPRSINDLMDVLPQTLQHQESELRFPVCLGKVNSHISPICTSWWMHATIFLKIAMYVIVFKQREAPKASASSKTNVSEIDTLV